MFSRLDWYQATAKAPLDQVLEGCSTLPGASDMEHGRGKLNYAASTTFRNSDFDVLATVLHGGNRGGCHVIGTGEAAPALAEMMRKWWPDHRVSRLDSACDLEADYAVVQRQCQAIAQAAGIKGRSIVPDNPDDGATYYMGSPASAAALRCYEKGKQLLAAPNPPPGVSASTIRLEVQFRPPKEAKGAAATWSPDQVWGASPWCRKVAREVLQADVERIRQIARRLSNDDRIRLYVASTYRAFFLREFERFGDWATIGEGLGSIVDALDADSRR